MQMNGYIISLILDKNPKDYQMTRKLLEIERKRQLTGDAKELIKHLQDLGNACGFASAMVLLR